MLSEADSKALLRDAGIALPKEVLVTVSATSSMPPSPRSAFRWS